MRASVSISDFTFRHVSSGAYVVTYDSWNDFLRHRYWSARIEDMTLIDATKNCAYPKKKDLERLKRVVKSQKMLITY